MLNNIGIIEYAKTPNIGDYVQTIAAMKLAEQAGIQPVFLEREELKQYAGEPVHA